MRVILRTADTLVVEDGPDILLGAILAALGSLGILVAWTKGFGSKKPVTPDTKLMARMIRKEDRRTGRSRLS